MKRDSDRHSLIGRRDAIKAGGLLAAGAALPLRASAGPKKLPNLIFILSDDHRWDHLGYKGHPFIKTPSLDRLAAEGVSFDNAFVTTSLCSPSRATFLTGTYPHRHGVKNNLTPWREDNVTYLELMKKMGYRTAFIGKWHMPGKIPEIPGVDLFITFTVQGGQGRYFNCPLIVNGVEEPSRKPYITEELTDRALEFIGADDTPYCLFLSHKAAHHQFLPPPETSGMYDDVELDLPREADQWITGVSGNVFYGTMGPLTMHYRNYCETLTALDSEIGRILDRLDKNGTAANTVVAYAGDNGFFWGEHRLVDKRWPYEPSIRVPFIVRAPAGMMEPGPREQMITNTDLAPTLMELVGEAPLSSMEGESFAPILGNAAAPGRDAWLYEYFADFPYNVPAHVAVRTRRHKYIEYEGRKVSELFDLAADPGEKNNLFGTEEGDALLPGLSERLSELKRKYSV